MKSELEGFTLHWAQHSPFTVWCVRGLKPDRCQNIGHWGCVKGVWWSPRRHELPQLSEHKLGRSEGGKHNNKIKRKEKQPKQKDHNNFDGESHKGALHFTSQGREHSTAQHSVNAGWRRDELEVNQHSAHQTWDGLASAWDAWRRATGSSSTDSWCFGQRKEVKGHS